MPQGAADTPYAGLTFRLSLKFTSEYPFKPPAVRFETPCFHPNVDTYGNICLDILKDKWSGQWARLEGGREGREAKAPQAGAMWAPSRAAASSPAVLRHTSAWTGGGGG